MGTLWHNTPAVNSIFLTVQTWIPCCVSFLSQIFGNMDKVELFEVVKVTEEVESAYSQMEVTSFKKRKSKPQDDSVEKPKKPR